MKQKPKKIILISFAAIVFWGASNHFFKDARADEITLRISINGQHPWSETFDWENFLPGDSKKINLVIKNIGADPVKIWKKIANLTNEENGITEPEGQWYADNDIVGGKNDMDSAIVYDLKIGSNIIIDPEENTPLSEVKNTYIYLGELAPNVEMTVKEGYYLKYDTGNWMQSDKMIFDIEILALSLDAPAPNAAIINIDEPGGDINNQYGYQYDYSNSAVSFTYDTPVAGKLSGYINAAGLKPYATYQVKFEGKPTCQYGAAGNDLANEYIGYKGRWRDNTTNSNVDDAYYEANSIYKGGTHCIIGYLVWDFFTVDAGGNAAKPIETANSYHVLWAGGGTCNSNYNDPAYLTNLDSAHPSVKFALAGKVDGQIERFVCGGMILDVGDYDLKMVLTEESFHQGNWAGVLEKDISFAIE